MKEKTIRGNQAPFMNKELSNAIMTRSRIRNKYNKWKSLENFSAFKKAKNNCKKVAKKAKKSFYKKAMKNGTMTNKTFWNTIKPFMTNKVKINSNKIILEEREKVISNTEGLVEIFNNYYINIAETTLGYPPRSNGNPNDSSNDRDTVINILNEYRENPIIQKINENCVGSTEPFSLPLASTEEVNKIIKNLDTTKATGPDKIPPKLVKLCADVLDEPLKNILNLHIKNNIFPENAKTANITPIYKKGSRMTKSNYRPISILNVFSKIFERYIQQKIEPYIDTCLSTFISAYRAKYSSNHVLIRMLEERKQQLDDKKFVGAVLMDLSKAFDCVPHDLLIAKLNAYGFGLETLIFFYSYLKRRKQKVKIGNVLSNFQILLSGVPQGSILGPILFNIFINDILLWMQDSTMHNFADDNTISAFAKNIPDLIQILEKEAEIALSWFEKNEMIANPTKFQAIIINKCGRHNEQPQLKIGNETITSKKVVKLLGIKIDFKLNFSTHIKELCRKADGQLNGLCI